MLVTQAPWTIIGSAGWIILILTLTRNPVYADEVQINLAPDLSQEVRILSAPTLLDDDSQETVSEYKTINRIRITPVQRKRVLIQRLLPTLTEQSTNVLTNENNNIQNGVKPIPASRRIVRPDIVFVSNQEESQPAVKTTKNATTTNTRTKPNVPKAAPTRRRPSQRTRNRFSSSGSKELMKQKLEHMLIYFPMVKEKVIQLGQKVYKNEQASYSGRIRLWKELRQLRTNIMLVDNKCDRVARNMTYLTNRVNKQTVNFNSFRLNQKQKIQQIETHQGSQDLQYFDIIEKSSNNSHSIEQIHRILDRITPVINDFQRHQNRQELLEREAFEKIEAKSKEELDIIKNKLNIQSNEISDLTERVMNEVDILRSHKQLMANSLSAQRKSISESLNEQLSSQIKRMNNLEVALNRHAEAFKGISGQMSNRDEEIRQEKLKRVTVEKTLDNTHRGVNNLKRNMTTLESNINDIAKSNATMVAIDEKAENSMNGVSRNYADIKKNQIKISRAENKIDALTDSMEQYRESLNQEQDQALADIRANVKANAIDIKHINEKMTRDVRDLSEPVPQENILLRNAAPQNTSPAITPREIMSMIQESGFEDRMDRLGRIMRVHQIRLNNMTRAVERVNEDTQSVSLTTEQYFSLINTQEKVIRDQNKTIGNLTNKINEQADLLRTLSSEIQHQQETVIKLTNIVINLSQQLRVPKELQRDCHDLYTTGHTRSGVYTITEGMGTRLVYCNMTESGGWTVIQRRVNGNEDFDKNMKEYRDGFGDIFLDYWVGLDAIRTMTQFQVNTLRVLLEDWQGNVRQASYSYFALSGPEYRLEVRGYNGNGGDSFMNGNSQPFAVPKKDESNLWAHNECAVTRHGGWWFGSLNQNCGMSNLNGRFISKDQRVMDTSNIYWNSWRGSVLKSVSMQIIPTHTQPIIDTPMDLMPLQQVVYTKDGDTSSQNSFYQTDTSNSNNSNMYYLNEEDYNYVESPGEV